MPSSVTRYARGGWFIGAAVAFASAGLLWSPASGDTGNSNGPDNSNGSVKVTDVSEPDQPNEPHLTSPFELSIWGFDVGTDTATVVFNAQPPSGDKDRVVPITQGPATFSFVGSGDKQVFDTSRNYALDTSGLKVQPEQGVHIKVTVTVTPGTTGHARPSAGHRRLVRHTTAKQGNANNNAGGNGNGNGGANNGNGNGNGAGNGNGNGGGAGGGNGGGAGGGNAGPTVKFKVFWLTPATPRIPPPKPTPTPTPTPSVGAVAGIAAPTPTPSASPTASPSPSPSVLGEKVTRQLPPAKVKAVRVSRLPFTGTPVTPLLLVALGCLLAGRGLMRSTAAHNR